MSLPRYCECSTPLPVEHRDAYLLCERCGEALRPTRDKLLVTMARAVAELERKVASLEVQRSNGSGHHLSRAKRRELIASAIRQAPEQSNRELARQLGVSHPTVAAVRRKLAEVESGAESLSRKGSA